MTKLETELSQELADAKAQLSKIDFKINNMQNQIDDADVRLKDRENTIHQLKAVLTNVRPFVKDQNRAKEIAGVLD